MPPHEGEPIKKTENGLEVPDYPIIPYIEGDGVGMDLWAATRLVLDMAIAKSYGGQRKIAWFEVQAGDKAYHTFGEWLPLDTIDTFRRYWVGLKGPLTGRLDSGRNLTLALRQELDLYACVRPFRAYEGIPSPVSKPEDVAITLFREATEDSYGGYEWQTGSSEMKQIAAWLQQNLDMSIPEDASLGLRIISKAKCERIVRKAIQYAIAENKKSVTLVHKQDALPRTDGYFLQWAYALAEREFPHHVVLAKDLGEQKPADLPLGKLVLQDRLADTMFVHLLSRPKEYEILVALNQTGDYLSSALAAQVGGLGVAPGANLSDEVAIFEAVHGTVPKLAGLNQANPTSLILSGAMMLEYIGWREAADAIQTAFTSVLGQKKVTADLARTLKGAKVQTTSAFASLWAEAIPAPKKQKKSS